MNKIRVTKEKLENTYVRVFKLTDGSNDTWFSVDDMAKAFHTNVKDIVEQVESRDSEVMVLTYDEFHDTEMHCFWKNDDKSDKTFVYEPSFYQIMLFSKFSNTKSGQNMSNWVFGDVVPSIFKNGRYDLPKGDK